MNHKGISEAGNWFIWLVVLVIVAIIFYNMGQENTIDINVNNGTVNVNVKTPQDIDLPINQDTIATTNVTTEPIIADGTWSLNFLSSVPFPQFRLTLVRRPERSEGKIINSIYLRLRFWVVEMDYSKNISSPK